MFTVVQFGAGNIGRGFLGQLYSQSGWKTIYVDVVPETIELLNNLNGFAVHIVGEGKKTVTVENVEAVDGKDIAAVAEAIDKADLLGTSVGVNALPYIIPALVSGLEKRAKRGAGIDMIICENLLNSSDFLRSKILEQIEPDACDFVKTRLGLVETVVSRMIPVITSARREQDPLAVWAEAYDLLPVDRNGFFNNIPEIKGFEPTSDIHAYEERKLFCHNCMHCLASYFGFAKGLTYVWEAIENPDIQTKVRAGGWEAGKALISRHGFSEAEYSTHIEDLLRRFSNQELADTVARCGRDPLRKLGRNDRLVGAALAALAGGKEPKNIISGIVAGLTFNPQGDPSADKLQQLLRQQGIAGVLTQVMGLKPEEPLSEKILQTAKSAGLVVSKVL